MQPMNDNSTCIYAGITGSILHETTFLSAIFLNLICPISGCNQTEVCGGHGELNGTQCVCEYGYEAPVENNSTCVWIGMSD